jgi:hypothetical protein
VAAGITLRRLALVEFSPAPGDAGSIQGVYADVVVETLSTAQAGGALKALLVAACPLDYLPKRTRDGYVVVPSEPRRRCEHAIEAFADLISISGRCRRSIASPLPWVVFEATTDTAGEWLDDSAGIHELDHVVDIPRASSSLPLEPNFIDGLRDRSDGTVLLAEALAQTHPTGQLRDFFRVFERAFAIPARQLAGPLEALLDSRYGYTSRELDNWIDVRDGATHADVRKRLIVEADVWPILSRIRQAAYDVLLNKKLWRDASTDRRDLWSPTGWTAGPAGDVVIRQHTVGRLEAHLFDQFGAYPTDLQGVVSSLPVGWWAPAVSPQTPERRFQVIPPDD